MNHMCSKRYWELNNKIQALHVMRTKKAKKTYA